MTLDFGDRVTVEGVPAVVLMWRDDAHILLITRGSTCVQPALADSLVTGWPDESRVEA